MTMSGVAAAKSDSHFNDETILMSNDTKNLIEDYVIVACNDQQVELLKTNVIIAVRFRNGHCDFKQKKMFLL